MLRETMQEFSNPQIYNDSFRSTVIHSREYYPVIFHGLDTVITNSNPVRTWTSFNNLSKLDDRNVFFFKLIFLMIYKVNIALKNQPADRWRFRSSHKKCIGYVVVREI
jgi:hypothetical protein